MLMFMQPVYVLCMHIHVDEVVTMLTQCSANWPSRGRGCDVHTCSEYGQRHKLLTPLHLSM